MGRGNLDAARELVTRALGTQRRTSLLVRLAEIEDERGDVARAAGLATEALRHLLEADGDPVSKRPLLRRLSPLLVDREAEVSRLLRGADAISGQIDRLPADSVPAGEVTLPIVRFAAAPELRPESVGIRLCFVSPLPVCRYRLWLNGRPIGPASGFDLPGPDEKGRLLDKGRLLEKGESLDESRVFEKGRLLEKGEDRVALAAELPAEVAALVRLPQYSQLVQIRHSVPVEDSDGEFIRIAIQAETTGGSVSDREIQRLRRPQVEQARGSLRVLAVGIGDYPLLPKLKYAAADAISLADAFRSQAEPESSASLYRGADIRLLVNADATLARIREALDQLATDTRPGDTVVLALSGHGIAVRPPAVDLSNLPAEAMMAAKPAPTQTYFAPARFDPENPAGTGLPWSEVVARLEPLRKVAKTVWLLADCCRSAPGLRRTPAPDMPLRKGEVLAADTRDLKRGLDEGGNLILCAASDADTPSYESDDLKHGLFTQAWLEALRGEAPDGVYRDVPRGRVLTLSGLQFWLDASVTKHARSVGVRQRVEFPRLEGSFSPSMPVFVPVTR
jgi:hypothetical protein